MKHLFDEPKPENYLCSGWLVAAMSTPDMQKWQVYDMTGHFDSPIEIESLCLELVDRDQELARLAEVRTKLVDRLERVRAAPKVSIRKVKLFEGKIGLTDAKMSVVEEIGPDQVLGRVAGYWNLAYTEWAEGREEWPFGQEPWDGTRSGLVSLLPQGRVIRPTVPTLAQANQWVQEKNLVAPAFDCSCGAVHADGGPVVGLSIEPGVEREFISTEKSVRLVLEEDPEGHRRKSCLLYEVLQIHDAVLLDQVEPEGMAPPALELVT